MRAVYIGASSLVYGLCTGLVLSILFGADGASFGTDVFTAEWSVFGTVAIAFSSGILGFVLPVTTQEPPALSVGQHIGAIVLTGVIALFSLVTISLVGYLVTFAGFLPAVYTFIRVDIAPTDETEIPDWHPEHIN
jgi:hypothetical protein